MIDLEDRSVLYFNSIVRAAGYIEPFGIELAKFYSADGQIVKASVEEVKPAECRKPIEVVKLSPVEEWDAESLRKYLLGYFRRLVELSRLKTQLHVTDESTLDDLVSFLLQMQKSY